ncbi:MAG: hypothetical protein HRU29_13805 [Rhizobiales bacterium]|nr:hypothetical protein [Hyphomicrobiales bacterium]NRB15468.1 hypothetical protein [Hyphomicrobiales bacterium]
MIEHPLFEFAFEVVFIKNHPLAAQKSVTATDISQYPLIALYQCQIRRTRQDGFFRSQNINIIPQFETPRPLSPCRFANKILASH